MNLSKLKPALLALTACVLAGCSDSSSPAPTIEPPAPPPAPPPVADARFEVSVVNLTLAQPLSPVAIMLHTDGFNSFIDGEPASLALETLAEGGSNVDILGEVAAAAQHLASGSTSGPVPPLTLSEAVALTVPSDQLDDVRLSVITMLVHTNDAFTGLNATDISNLDVGQSRVFTGPTWDSGTELNDESGANMPGPAFGGEGFNPARDDLFDRVHFHTGIVTNESVDVDSGSAESDLTDRFRFDNPTSRIIVTRIE